jgi:hypothetical protein
MRSSPLSKPTLTTQKAFGRTGIASPALVHRFSSGLSSWPGSIRVVHSPPAATTSTVIVDSALRRTRSSIPAIKRSTLTGSGSKGLPTRKRQTADASTPPRAWLPPRLAIAN